MLTFIRLVWGAWKPSVSPTIRVSISREKRKVQKVSDQKAELSSKHVTTLHLCDLCIYTHLGSLAWIIAMDPLSIIASIIAIGSFATASLNVILKIRGASDEVQALINEISDLSAIIKDVEHTLRYNKRLNAESNGVATLHAVLSKAHTTINHLHAFVSRVLMKEETLLRDARISRTTWLREKPQVSKYQRQLLAIKLELSHALGIANL